MTKSACFVATIDLSLAEKLKSDLKEQGFALTQPLHTLFSAQKEGVSCTLYSSGKLTVQGKAKEDFIAFYLEPEILGKLSYTYPEMEIDFSPRIGIDEAGKGDFFGPLCIAGVQANEEKIRELLEMGVKDSKRMSDPSVLALSKKIRLSLPHSIVRISPPKYNELYEKFGNLNRLLGWGHATAIAELIDKTGCVNVVIDQFAADYVVKNALEQKKVEVNLTQRHKAESDPVVAAASILARAAFLEGLKQLEQTVASPLPKGASQLVIDAGKTLIAKQGEQILRQVGKLHFKTREQILGSLLCGILFLMAPLSAMVTVPHPNYPRDLEAEFRAVGKAEMTKGKVKHTHLLYRDATAGINYTQFLNEKNSLVWQVGYQWLDIDWPENPRFSDQNFNYGIASLGWISDAMAGWHWVVNGGVSVDVKNWDFGKTAVYYGLGWGRYQYQHALGLHLGIYGYQGVENGYVLPIIGFDWQMNPHWRLNVIYPLDISLEYQFTRNWSTELNYSAFGGPYRFPRRAHDGIGRYRDAIFEIYSTGVDWDINYKFESRFLLGAGVGYNFGGWLLIKDSHNHHGKYYPFDSAPYGQLYLDFKF